MTPPCTDPRQVSAFASINQPNTRSPSSPRSPSTIVVILLLLLLVLLLVISVTTAFLSIGRIPAKPTAPAAAGMTAAAAGAQQQKAATAAAEEMEEYEIEDTMSFSPRKACEYVYDQVRSTVANPKLVFGVTFDDAAAVPVLDCDVQLRSVSVLKISVWYVVAWCVL